MSVLYSVCITVYCSACLCTIVSSLKMSYYSMFYALNKEC